MVAYAIFVRDRLRSQKDMDTYGAAAGGTLAGHTVTPLVVYGKVEGLEGSTPDGVVVLQFPTIAEAKAWYESDSYKAAREHRFKGADYRAFIVEGL